LEDPVRVGKGLPVGVLEGVSERTGCKGLMLMHLVVMRASGVRGTFLSNSLFGGGRGGFHERLCVSKAGGGEAAGDLLLRLGGGVAAVVVLLK
jgi:hypothetical protein